MKKLIIFLLFALAPHLTQALNTEVHITKDGQAKINEIKVMQLAGQTLFARMYWGESFVRITIKTNNGTSFYRATGEKTTISEISVNDILDVEGELEAGGSQLVIIPKVIRNVSIQKQQSVLSGKVTSIDYSKNIFLLNDLKKGLVNVSVGTTTRLIKGNRIIDLGRLKAGDTITEASGDYDYKTKTLDSRNINIYLDMNIFKPKIHEGVISSIGGTTLPTEVSVKIGNTIYTVYLNNSSSVINKDRKNVNLSRFEAGDKVRLYGSIRETDNPLLDAEVLRNMDI